MKVTLAAAMKMAKELDNQKNAVMREMFQNLTYEQIGSEAGPTTVDMPTKTVVQYLLEIDEIDEKIMSIKNAIYAANLQPYKEDGTNLSQSLLKMAVLSKLIGTMERIMYANPSRSVKDKFIITTKLNFDKEQMKALLESQRKDLQAIQLEVDSANMTILVEVK